MNVLLPLCDAKKDSAIEVKCEERHISLLLGGDVLGIFTLLGSWPPCAWRSMQMTLQEQDNGLRGSVPATTLISSHLQMLGSEDQKGSSRVTLVQTCTPAR